MKNKIKTNTGNHIHLNKMAIPMTIRLREVVLDNIVNRVERRLLKNI